ncbi:MAG TPA: lysophospholipid acyltransferase family protein [Pirellulales bacterium]|nr:lysophospholipid acyltransferase family protein [Pirellulales bacterium]
MRVHGREHEPPGGSALVLSNHESHLDPVVVCCSFQRRLNFLARSSLFQFPPLRWFLLSVDSIPIEREGMGMSGLKETLRRLKRQEMVLIFPEGTRSRDGSIGKLKLGFCMLARRASVPLVPVGIAGSYDAWPRSRKFPRPAVIHVQIGESLKPEQFEQMDDEQLMVEMQRRIESCHANASRQVRQARHPDSGEGCGD